MNVAETIRRPEVSAGEPMNRRLGQNCKTERTERRNLEIPSVIGCISPYICPHTWNKKAGSSQYLYALVFLLQKTFIILPVFDRI